MDRVPAERGAPVRSYSVRFVVRMALPMTTSVELDVRKLMTSQLLPSVVFIDIFISHHSLKVFDQTLRKKTCSLIQIHRHLLKHFHGNFSKRLYYFSQITDCGLQGRMSV